MGFFSMYGKRLLTKSTNMIELITNYMRYGIMKEVYDFLKKCGAFYLATLDGTQPRVRPMAAFEMFEGRIYFLTGKNKNVSAQMNENPKIEICAYDGEKWIRIEALAINDDRIEPKQHILNSYPFLQSTYKAGDFNTQVLYLKDATANICTFQGIETAYKF